MIRTAALRARRTWRAASLMAHTATTDTRVAPLAPCLSRAMTTSSKPIEKEELRWRFPADDRTENMVTQVEHGVGQTIAITLNSTAPITHDLVEETLFHLYDKIESLRLCFRQRQGQLWVADMPQRKLDFQSVSGRNLVDENEALSNSPFDLHDGPLWKARLMTGTEDDPCYVPEVKAAFPHQCNLLLSVHHAANDGPVVMLMTELILRIIDSLLQGVPVDTQPVGELRDSVEAREEEKRIKTALESDPQRLVAELNKHWMSKQLPLFLETFGIPKVTNPTTRFLTPVILDNQVLDKIAGKCRSIGATLNSGLNAILNMTAVELALDAGLERDVYNISNRLPVDSRRLIKDCKNFPLGFHAIPMTHCTPTPRNVKKHFWPYVKNLDTELREKLKRNYMCEERVLDEMMRPEGYTHEDYYTHRQVPSCNFIFSNMYSPRASNHNQGVGKNVQITWIGNYMFFHNERYVMGEGIFTFRGQARLQFAYSTAAISEEVVQRCIEKNVALLHDVAKSLD